jgi:hypothetical protein
MAVRDIPTTDIINANADTKLVIVTCNPYQYHSWYRALETIKYYNLPIKLYIVKPSEFSTTLLDQTLVCLDFRLKD